MSRLIRRIRREDGDWLYHGDRNEVDIKTTVTKRGCCEFHITVDEPRFSGLSFLRKKTSWVVRSVDELKNTKIPYGELVVGPRVPRHALPRRSFHAP